MFNHEQIAYKETKVIFYLHLNFRFLYLSYQFLFGAHVSYNKKNVERIRGLILLIFILFMILFLLKIRLLMVPLSKRRLLMVLLLLL